MQKLARYLDFMLSSNLIMASLFVFIGAILSVNLRYEIFFDLYNYHYFLPWAFFHDRTFTDIAMAIENSYHNPLIDMPVYFLVQYFNEQVWVYYTFFGIFWGLLMFVFYKLCRNVLRLNQKIELFLILMISMTGFATLSQIGTSSGEVFLSLGTITTVYWLHKEIFITAKERPYVIFCAGFLLGAMFGFKLTAVTYCLGAGLALILFFKYLQRPYKTIFCFALGGIIGFLCIDGFWMWKLYQEFGNPLFPYLNNIFKSEYIDKTMFSYNSALYEKSFLDYLIFPYLVLFNQEERIAAEVFFRDPRFAIGYTLLLIAAGSYLVSWLKKQKYQINIGIMFLLAFVVLSYLVWLFVLPVIRYAIPMELLGALLGVLYFSAIKPKQIFGFAVWCGLGIILLFALFSGLPYPVWSKRAGETQLIYKNDVHLPKNSLILSLSAGTGAMAARIAENNPDVKFANMTAFFVMRGDKWTEKIEQYKKDSSYIAYMTVLKSPLKEFDYHTPTKYVLTEERLEGLLSNLKYVIQNYIGVDKFYCQDISKAPNHLIKVFLCIDKKDKDMIFPSSQKSMMFNPYTETVAY